MTGMGSSQDAIAEAYDVVRAVVVSAEAAVPPAEYALVRARMGDLLRTEDRRPPDCSDPRVAQRAQWPTSALFSDTDRMLLALAEQYTLDVTGVDDDQRAQADQSLGEFARTWVSVLYAIDVELRLDAVLAQLLPASPGFGGGRAGELTQALNAMTRELARLDALDPLTTELVRLRGARVHDCRMCKALRLADALEAGGGESLYDDIDRYESSAAFTEAQKVALRLTDAVLFTPAVLSADLVEQARRHFTEAQIVEIVLDVERNARNKVAVTNGTDGDGVGEGTTRYRVDSRGEFDLVDAGPGISDPRGRF